LRAAVRPSHRPLAIQTPQAVDWASLPEAPEVESRPLSWYDHILEVAR